MIINTKHIKLWNKKILFLGMLLVYSFVGNAQVKTSIDSTSIKIGEELMYTIETEVDSAAVVLFPEGQTFQPMEVIESYPVDTVLNDVRLKLIKKYGRDLVTVAMELAIDHTDPLIAPTLENLISNQMENVHDIAPLTPKLKQFDELLGDSHGCQPKSQA